MTRLAWISIALALLLVGAIGQSAALSEGSPETGTYEVLTRDGTPAQPQGRAVRDAAPAADGGASHSWCCPTATRATAT